MRTLYQDEHTVEALLRARNDRVVSTGKEPARIRSQSELDGNSQLDRLTVKQARPGQAAPAGPIYLARDSLTNHQAALPILGVQAPCRRRARSRRSSGCVRLAVRTR